MVDKSFIIERRKINAKIVSIIWIILGILIYLMTNKGIFGVYLLFSLPVIWVIYLMSKGKDVPWWLMNGN